MLKFVFSKTAIVLLFVQRGITSSNNLVKKKECPCELFWKFVQLQLVAYESFVTFLCRNHHQQFMETLQETQTNRWMCNRPVDKTFHLEWICSVRIYWVFSWRFWRGKERRNIPEKGSINKNYLLLLIYFIFNGIM